MEPLEVPDRLFVPSFVGEVSLQSANESIPRRAKFLSPEIFTSVRSRRRIHGRLLYDMYLMQELDQHSPCISSMDFSMICVLAPVDAVRQAGSLVPEHFSWDLCIMRFGTWT
jgi:hypothetical protein